MLEFSAFLVSFKKKVISISLIVGLSLTSLVARADFSCLQCRRPGFDHWIRKIPWRRKWQAPPGFLPGNPMDREEPGGLQSMGSQESDMT